MTFENLSPVLSDALTARGYEALTPVQSQVSEDQAKGRDGKPQGGNRPDRNEHRPDRNDRGGKPQQAKFEARPPRKEKPIDPDSPFAKLAALKEQLKK